MNVYSKWLIIVTLRLFFSCMHKKLFFLLTSYLLLLLLCFAHIEKTSRGERLSWTISVKIRNYCHQFTYLFTRIISVSTSTHMLCVVVVVLFACGFFAPMASFSCGWHFCFRSRHRSAFRVSFISVEIHDSPSENYYKKPPATKNPPPVFPESARKAVSGPKKSLFQLRVSYRSVDCNLCTYL